MSSAEIVSITNNHAQSQDASTGKVSDDIRLTHQDSHSGGIPPKGSLCVKESKANFSQSVVLANDSKAFTSSTPDTTAQKTIQWRTGQTEPQAKTRSRPTSSRHVSHREFLTNGSSETRKSPLNQPVARTTTDTHLDLSTPQATESASNTNAPSSIKRTPSRLSCISATSPEHRDKENISPALPRNQRAVSCDPHLPGRSCSSQSKYHEACFPKEDPALIIGSPYRILSARHRRTKSAQKRPIIRHRESVFTIRESVVNLVYTAQSETEQDELDRAKEETERDVRALRSGGLTSGSFSQGFFHHTKRWAFPS
ncbi:hypothetical protein EGW08_008915, partial [Elysia chlorotica]